MEDDKNVIKWQFYSVMKPENIRLGDQEKYQFQNLSLQFKFEELWL